MGQARGWWESRSPLEKFGIGSGLGGIGAGLGSLFFGDSQDPSKAGMGYLDKIPDAISGYYNPYINAGKGELPGLKNQYNQLMNDPGARLNQIGQGYHQSPGFQFALQQALGANNRQQAAGGMAGSPQNGQQDMGIATGMADKDYNDWMQNALGMYGTGLSGGQHMADQGLDASKGLSDQIAQTLAAQSKLAYNGANQQNQNRGGVFSSMLSGAASMAPFI